MKETRRVRYDVTGASKQGVTIHPQKDMLLHCDRLVSSEPVTIADCWLFDIEGGGELPDYCEVLPKAEQ